jgi:hypothetical protein
MKTQIDISLASCIVSRIPIRRECFLGTGFPASSCGSIIYAHGQYPQMWIELFRVPILLAGSWAKSRGIWPQMNWNSFFNAWTNWRWSSN